MTYREDLESIVLVLVQIRFWLALQVFISNIYATDGRHKKLDVEERLKIMVFLCLIFPGTHPTR